ncbi:hypothetical protein Ancab_021409 [Ancistrocladus abbreviatus]
MNYDLELRLQPSSLSSSSSAGSGSIESSADESYHQQKQQMTIFYGGRMCVSDVTELQGRALICLAKEEVQGSSGDSKFRTNSSSNLQQKLLYNSPAPAPAPAPVAAFVMRRSLQQFLQKRNQRIRTAASPYHYKKVGLHLMGKEL